MKKGYLTRTTEESWFDYLRAQTSSGAHPASYVMGAISSVPECKRGRKFKLISAFNPLKTKRRLLYLKTQFVPRSKHFSSRL